MAHNIENKLAQILDDSLDRLAAGEPMEKVLASYPHEVFWLREALEQAASIIAQKTKFNPLEGFLQASRWRLLRRIRLELGVSAGVSSILENLLSFLGGQRRFAFQLASGILILGVLLTGFMGTALASQSSLPGDRLYAIKLTLEETHLLLSMDPVTEANLELQYADNRLGEMQALVDTHRSEYLPQTLQHYQQHLWQALVLLDQVAQSGNPARKTRAGELAHSLRNRLVQQAAQLNVIDAQVRADNQTLSASFQQVATQQSVQMQQLAVQIETQTTEAPTLLPASRFEPTRTSGSEPTGMLSGGGSGAAAATSVPVQTSSQTSIVAGHPAPSATIFISSSDLPLLPSLTPSLDVGASGASETSPTKKPANTSRPTNTRKPSNTPRLTNTPHPTNTDQPIQQPADPLPTPKPTNPNRPTPKPTNPNKP